MRALALSNAVCLPLPVSTSWDLVAGWEAGDSRHRGGSVGWSSTQPRKRRLPCPGGVCWWTEQRVSADIVMDFFFLVFILKVFRLLCVLCSRPRGVISTPVIRTFGRGGRHYTRAFQRPGAYLVSQCRNTFHNAFLLPNTYS